MQHICCICYLLQTDNIAKYIHSTAAFLQQPPFWYLCVYPGIVQLLKPHHHAKFGIDWIRNDIVMPFAANIPKCSIFAAFAVNLVVFLDSKTSTMILVCLEDGYM